MPQVNLDRARTTSERIISTLTDPNRGRPKLERDLQSNEGAGAEVAGAVKVKDIQVPVQL